MNVKVRTSIIILGILLILGLGTLFHIAQGEKYMSDDPLFGSFSIENGNLGDQIYPTDFLVSINVQTGHKELVSCAERVQIDLSKGCWVYCFAENQVYTATQDGMKLKVFDDGSEIGCFEYEHKKFLFFSYGEAYKVTWRNVKYDLKKDLQGFIFP
ncbi:MAG: hypothetical protein PUB87_08330 [Eubacteriaceae bacterium]|nr:hypothetical protein [Eubacteriaceae bacterium]